MTPLASSLRRGTETAMTEERDDSLPGRIVVVSPHLDDAIFSLGATIARLTRSGTAVDVLTVFAGAPESSVPAARWDARAGFATEGAAAAGRRDEDREACGHVGARPVWLPFPDGGYGRPRDPHEVSAAVATVVAGADAVLVPGFPLTNPDHAWLSELLLSEPLPVRLVGWYVEQPYAFWLARGEGRATAPAAVVRPRAWEHTEATARDRWAKWRAVRAYRSQLPLLGPSWRRAVKPPRVLFERALGTEALAWPRRPAAERAALDVEESPPTRPRRDLAASIRGYDRAMQIVESARDLWRTRTPEPFRTRVNTIRARRRAAAWRKPRDLGDLRRTTPFSTWGKSRGGPIDRYYIERFMDEHSADIRGRVLEIAGDEYIRKFGRDAERAEILDIKEDNPHATFVADLADAPNVPDDTFDCVIATQIVPLIYDFGAALRTCHRILVPGGIMLMTTPGICRIAPIEAETFGHWWSLTSMSAERACSEIFGAENVRVQTYGNVLSAAAFLFGLGPYDLTREELAVHDPSFQVTVAVRAVKRARTGA